MRRHKTSLEAQSEAMLHSLCRGLSSVATIRLLMELELIDLTATKALMAQKQVEALCRQKVHKMEAMQMVAEALHCSDGTIHNYIYTRRKHNN
jgi:hypothetical protein